jgi:hypothetical protein
MLCLGFTLVLSAVAYANWPNRNEHISPKLAGRLPTLEVGAPIVNDYPVYKFKTELRTVKQF